MNFSLGGAVSSVNPPVAVTVSTSPSRMACVSVIVVCDAWYSTVCVMFVSVPSRTTNTLSMVVMGRYLTMIVAGRRVKSSVGH